MFKGLKGKHVNLFGFKLELGDRNSILAFFYLIVLILTFLLVWKVSAYMGAYLIFIVITVYQQLMVIPLLNKLYIQMHEKESGGFSRFIPLYNEVSLFSSFSAMAVFVLGILTVVLGLAAALPALGINFITTAIEGLFGQRAGLNYTFYCFVFAIVSYLVLLVLRGLAYAQVRMTIEAKNLEYFKHKKYKPYEVPMYFLLFIPMARVIALLDMVDTLNKLLIINDVRNASDIQFKEEINDEHSGRKIYT